MAPRRSPGHCDLCKQAVDRSRLRSHLIKCLAQHPAGKVQVPAWLLEVRALPYWLALSVRQDATLADLDTFFRRIWLGGGKRLSAFTIAGQQYGSAGFDAEGPGLSPVLGDVFTAGSHLAYDFDFDAATSLDVRVLQALELIQKQPVRLLLRNDPPEIACQVCEQPASEICGVCIWSGEGALCEAHAREHTAHARQMLPIVNSPRCGIGGYRG